LVTALNPIETAETIGIVDALTPETFPRSTVLLAAM
jgi:hypothetical protein